MKSLIFSAVVSLFFLINLSGCRQIFGDGTAPESIVEVPYETSQIVVTNPAYAAIWRPGDLLKIKWIATSISKIEIQLYRKSSYQFTLANNIENTGSFDWQIPIDINISNHYLLKIINHSNPDVYQFSDRFGIQN